MYMNTDETADGPDDGPDDGEVDPIDALGDGQLSTKQQAAIVALLNEPTLPKAAEAAKIGKRTLVRWLSEPVFKRAFLTARRDAFSHAIGLTQRFAKSSIRPASASVQAES